jgi:hypothetical protein
VDWTPGVEKNLLLLTRIEPQPSSLLFTAVPIELSLIYVQSEISVRSNDC